MKKMITALVAMLLTTQCVFAALPPLAQSLKELKAILNSDEVADSLGMAEPIIEISRTEEGYLIRTQSQKLSVDVIYKSSKIIGPVPFDLKFHKTKQSNSMRR